VSELFAALLQDTVGRWFLYFGALVFFCVLAVLAFLSIRKTIRKALGELGVIRHEVKNDHTTNMRVEQDDRHTDNTRALARIEAKVDEALVKLGVHEWRINELASDVENTRDRRPDAPH
jgi:hypothetical protein